MNAPSSENPLSHAYWLTVRGEQQMDLACRFASRANELGLRVLALKGISIATRLYGSLDRRPMADIDFLIVDADHFVRAADLARSLGLVETEASDHALVFKEPSSGVVLELHISLTSCPGLFAADHGALWDRRTAVEGTSLVRLGDSDLVVHLALHTAFQHGFSANEFHYGDFLRALMELKPAFSSVADLARERRATVVLGAMAVAVERRFPGSEVAARCAREWGALCPAPLARWIANWTHTPPMFRLRSMAFVRYHLAPSKISFLFKTAFPKPIPGRTLPRRGSVKRLIRLFDTARTAPAPSAK